jgi:hypothetical protein
MRSGGRNLSAGRWALAQDETARLTPGRDRVVVSVEQGCIVVTQEGDPKDHVLGPGDLLQLSERGLAVAWALRPSEIVVVGGREAAAASRPGPLLPRAA